jgi:hypothetical protein
MKISKIYFLTSNSNFPSINGFVEAWYFTRKK